MTLGYKLKKLRNEKELTQKDLADQLHVSFQTVSKWENDENEPDITTLRELAKLFEVSVDYLISEDESLPKKDEAKETEEKMEEEQSTPIIIKKELHVCSKCGNRIQEDELAQEQIPHHKRTGRITHTTYSTNYYHKSCLEQVQKERATAKIRAAQARAKRAKKLSFGWGIAGGVVALTIALLVFLLQPTLQQSVHPALAVLYSVLIGYGIFAMLYCIISGSYIGDVFVWCAGLSIKFPGLIFSWSLEGFAWLIAMKILFAILGFLIGVLALIFAIFLSAALGSVSFPFVLIHNIHTNYSDSLND